MSEIQAPKVSVILPTFNRALDLPRSIESVLNQTFQDFELIVVDDGSTDDTKDVIERINSKKIRYLRHDRNRGAAAARNTGLKLARGAFIAFQDSDDEWRDDKLEKHMQAFSAVPAMVGVVYSGFWRIRGRKKVYLPASGVEQKDGHIYAELLKGNFVTPQCATVRRDCFGKVGFFDERLPPLEDWDLFIRMSRLYEFKYIEEPLTTIHQSSDGILSNYLMHVKAFELINDKHELPSKLDKRFLARHFFFYGHLLCGSGDFKKGRVYFCRSFSLRPTGFYVGWFLLFSFLGQRAYKWLAWRWGL